MRLYWEVARTTARRTATYRAATFAGIVTNTVFGFILSYVMLAVFRERPTIGGFDAVDAVTFTFVTQGLLMVVGIFGSDYEMAYRVQSGEVAMDLSRPYDYQAWWAAVAYGKSFFYACARAAPPFLVGALVLHLRLPPHAWIWPAFALAVFLAVGVAFAFGFVVQLSAFWVVDVRGPSQIAWMPAGFLAGSYVPMFLFPDGIEQVVRLLPFAAMIQLPVEVFLGKHSGGDLLALYGMQVGWLVVLLALGRLVLARATRRVVVHGG
jgi:ABC-2 type transport system permease protein